MNLSLNVLYFKLFVVFIIFLDAYFIAFHGTDFVTFIGCYKVGIAKWLFAQIIVKILFLLRKRVNLLLKNWSANGLLVFLLLIGSFAKISHCTKRSSLTRMQFNYFAGYWDETPLFKENESICGHQHYSDWSIYFHLCKYLNLQRKNDFRLFCLSWFFHFLNRFIRQVISNLIYIFLGS